MNTSTQTDLSTGTLTSKLSPPSLSPSPPPPPPHTHTHERERERERQRQTDRQTDRQSTEHYPTWFLGTNRQTPNGLDRKERPAHKGRGLDTERCRKAATVAVAVWVQWDISTELCRTQWVPASPSSSPQSAAAVMRKYTIISSSILVCLFSTLSLSLSLSLSHTHTHTHTHIHTHTHTHTSAHAHKHTRERARHTHSCAHATHTHARPRAHTTPHSFLCTNMTDGQNERPVHKGRG